MGASLLAMTAAHSTRIQADPPLSRASSLPQGIWVGHKFYIHRRSSVGASLLAMTAAHPTRMQADPPPSRASSLPQWIHSGSTVNTGLMAPRKNIHPARRSVFRRKYSRFDGFLIFGSCVPLRIQYNRRPPPGMEAVRFSRYEKKPCSSAVIPPPLFRFPCLLLCLLPTPPWTWPGGSRPPRGCLLYTSPSPRDS